MFNIAAPRTGEKKTSLDSGVQGCFPQGRRRGMRGRERERVCVCVGGGRPSVLALVLGLELLGSSLHHGVLAHLPLLVSSIARRKSCLGCFYLYISLFSAILSIVLVFFVFIPCFCSHFSCAAYLSFSDSWAVFWFGSKGLNGMPDLFLLLLLHHHLLLPLLVFLPVL